MARIVVAGAGVVGASIAYHLALRGANDVVLVDAGTVGSGATGKALGGVRQQFSTAPEVRLARESVAFFNELGAPLFEPVGYLFLATSEEGLEELEHRRLTQVELGVPVKRVDASFVPGLTVDDVLGAVFCAEDGTADPAAITRELVARAASLGVEVREGQDALDLECELLVLATGAASAGIGERLGVQLPVRPLVRQLVEVGPLDGLPSELPLTVEVESGFHFRRRGASLVLAMPEQVPRWSDAELVDDELADAWVARLASRYPRAAAAPLSSAWAGLYDMTPDAHPIIGRVADGVYAACGFSGHGFMQAPAVGRIVADEIMDGGVDFDLTPYRLGRFEDDTLFPESAIL